MTIDELAEETAWRCLHILMENSEFHVLRSKIKTQLLRAKCCTADDTCPTGICETVIAEGREVPIEFDPESQTSFKEETP